MRACSALLVLLLSGCASVAGLDDLRFDPPPADAGLLDAAQRDSSMRDASQAPDGEADDAAVPALCSGRIDSPLRDFQFSLREWRAHSHHKTFVEIVREDVGDFGRVQAVAVLEGIADEEYDLRMRRALVAGAHRVDFYADVNEDGVYSGLPTTENAGLDHAWREAGIANGCQGFVHNLDFDDIAVGRAMSAGGDFVLELRSLGASVGHAIVARLVTDDSAARTVGFYRLERAHLAEVTMRIPGIVSASDFYRVEVWVDLDDDGTFTAEADASWILDDQQAPTGTEFVVELDAETTTQTPVAE